MNAAVCLKLLLALCLIFGAKAQVDQSVIEVLMNQTIDECKGIENATDEDVAILFSDDDWPETREGKCFLECFFEEIGIFRNHKFNKRGFLALALMFFENIEDGSSEAAEFEELIRSVNENCGALKAKDRCDNALEFAKCSDKVIESFHIAGNMLNIDESHGAAEFDKEAY